MRSKDWQAGRDVGVDLARQKVAALRKSLGDTHPSWKMLEALETSIAHLTVEESLPPFTMHLIRTSCAYLHVPVADAMSGVRSKSAALARHIVIYALRIGTKKSLNEIARDLGVYDHASVKSALDKVQKILEIGDPIVAKAYEATLAQVVALTNGETLAPEAVKIPDDRVQIGREDGSAEGRRKQESTKGRADDHRSASASRRPSKKPSRRR